MKRQLIFVYNANSDLFSTVTDFAHKILSPSTYSCQLCALTYGNFSVRQDWKSFVEALPIEAQFLHKDEFEKTYKQQADLPVILISENGAIGEFASKQEIRDCTSLNDLKALVTEKLKQHVQHHHSNIQ